MRLGFFSRPEPDARSDGVEFGYFEAIWHSRKKKSANTEILVDRTNQERVKFDGIEYCDWAGECMDSTMIQTIAAVTQAIAAVLMLYTILVYHKQLEAVSKSTRAQNIKALFDLLFSAQVRESLAHVRDELHHKSFEQWGGSDHVHAGTVCAAYNLAALMADQKLIETNLVVDNWASSIVDCHNILKPYLESRRKTNGSTYWSGFSQLNYEAMKRGGAVGLVLPEL